MAPSTPAASASPLTGEQLQQAAIDRILSQHQLEEQGSGDGFPALAGSSAKGSSSGDGADGNAGAGSRAGSGGGGGAAAGGGGSSSGGSSGGEGAGTSRGAGSVGNNSGGAVTLSNSMSSLSAAAQVARAGGGGAKPPQMPGKGASVSGGGTESSDRRSSADDAGVGSSGSAVPEISLPTLAVKLSSLMKSGGSEVLLGEYACIRGRNVRHVPPDAVLTNLCGIWSYGSGSQLPLL